MNSELNNTPLRQWHMRRGARMVDFAGWWMPVQYSSIVEEHVATRSAVGVFDISHMGRFQFKGGGATDFLDRLLTRSVRDIKAGQIRYSLVTNEQGAILDDVLVYRLDEQASPSYMLVVNAGNRLKLQDWIVDQMAADEAVEFQDQTCETAMIAVQGPDAAAITAPLVDADLGSLRYYRGMTATVAGEPALISRTGYTGEDGYEVILAAKQAEPVWQQLLAAGERQGGRPAGLGARDTLRLEAAMPLYGHELSEEIDPFQAGLGFAVQLNGREFIGSQALAELQSQPGLPRRVGLEMSGRRVPRQGYRVLSGAGPVGEVTSGTFSPTLERPIAMAYVQPGSEEPGTELQVEIRDRLHPARVVPLPFYRRKSH